MIRFNGLSPYDIIKSSKLNLNWLVEGKNTGKSHMSWENLWFPVDFPLNQPIEMRIHGPKVATPNVWICSLAMAPKNRDTS